MISFILYIDVMKERDAVKLLRFWRDFGATNMAIVQHRLVPRATSGIYTKAYSHNTSHIFMSSYI